MVYMITFEKNVAIFIYNPLILVINCSMSNPSMQFNVGSGNNRAWIEILSQRVSRDAGISSAFLSHAGIRDYKQSTSYISNMIGSITNTKLQHARHVGALNISVYLDDVRNFL